MHVPPVPPPGPAPIPKNESLTWIEQLKADAGNFPNVTAVDCEIDRDENGAAKFIQDGENVKIGVTWKITINGVDIEKKDTCTFSSKGLEGSTPLLQIRLTRDLFARIGAFKKLLLDKNFRPDERIELLSKWASDLIHASNITGTLTPLIETHGIHFKEVIGGAYMTALTVSFDTVDAVNNLAQRILKQLAEKFKPLYGQEEEVPKTFQEQLEAFAKTISITSAKSGKGITDRVNWMNRLMRIKDPEQLMNEIMIEVNKGVDPNTGAPNGLIADPQEYFEMLKGQIGRDLESHHHEAEYHTPKRWIGFKGWFSLPWFTIEDWGRKKSPYERELAKANKEMAQKEEEYSDTYKIVKQHLESVAKAEGRKKAITDMDVRKDQSMALVTTRLDAAKRKYDNVRSNGQSKLEEAERSNESFDSKANQIRALHAYKLAAIAKRPELAALMDPPDVGIWAQVKKNLIDLNHVEGQVDDLGLINDFIDRFKDASTTTDFYKFLSPLGKQEYREMADAMFALLDEKLGEATVPPAAPAAAGPPPQPTPVLDGQTKEYLQTLQQYALQLGQVSEQNKTVLAPIKQKYFTAVSRTGWEDSEVAKDEKPVAILPLNQVTQSTAPPPTLRQDTIKTHSGQNPIATHTARLEQQGDGSDVQTRIEGQVGFQKPTTGFSIFRFRNRTWESFWNKKMTGLKGTLLNHQGRIKSLRQKRANCLLRLESALPGKRIRLGKKLAVISDKLEREKVALNSARVAAKGEYEALENGQQELTVREFAIRTMMLFRVLDKADALFNRDNDAYNAILTKIGEEESINDEGREFLVQFEKYRMSEGHTPAIESEFYQFVSDHPEAVDWALSKLIVQLKTVKGEVSQEEADFFDQARLQLSQIAEKRMKLGWALERMRTTFLDIPEVTETVPSSRSSRVTKHLSMKDNSNLDTSELGRKPLRVARTASLSSPPPSPTLRSSSHSTSSSPPIPPPSPTSLTSRPSSTSIPPPPPWPSTSLSSPPPSPTLRSSSLSTSSSSPPPPPISSSAPPARPSTSSTASPSAPPPSSSSASMPKELADDALEALMNEEPPPVRPPADPEAVRRATIAAIDAVTKLHFPPPPPPEEPKK